MKFRYFQAPESEMSELLKEEGFCSFCNDKTRVFQCKYKEIVDAKEHKIEGFGCQDCLKHGKFGFFHITELGYVDETGLHSYLDEEEEIRLFFSDAGGQISEGLIKKSESYANQNISAESIAELRKTPTFSSWQDTDWKVHCNDFMTYLGNWQPKNFVENSIDGNGRNLFLQIAEHEFHELWETDEVIEQEWSGGYIIFKCLHCGKLKGTYDFT